MLRLLETIAPVVAVRGNTDRGAVLGRLPEKASVTVAGVDFLVTHHVPGGPRPSGDVESPDAVVVFGHTHRPHFERLGTTLWLNPGSACRSRGGHPETVALVDVGGDGVKVDFERL